MTGFEFFMLMAFIVISVVLLTMWRVIEDQQKYFVLIGEKLTDIVATQTLAKTDLRACNRHIRSLGDHLILPEPEKACYTLQQVKCCSHAKAGNEERRVQQRRKPRSYVVGNNKMRRNGMDRRQT